MKLLTIVSGFFDPLFNPITILSILGTSLIFAGLMLYLLKKQSKAVSNVKVGDKIYFDGNEAEVLDMDETHFTVKARVSKMRSVIPKKK